MNPVPESRRQTIEKIPTVELKSLECWSEIGNEWLLVNNSNNNSITIGNYLLCSLQDSEDSIHIRVTGHKSENMGGAWSGTFGTLKAEKNDRGSLASFLIVRI